MAPSTSVIESIGIANLQVDTENYRIGPQNSQHEAIKAMIDEQGEKLVELAKDIIEIGMSPIDLVGVCAAADPGKFRVVEGNRRVTVLKLLNEPGLAAGTPIEKAIRNLALKHADKVPTSCECRVLDSKQAAFVWIQRRHDIGMGGAALNPWNAMSIRRAKEAHGNRQSALEVIDFVSNHAGVTENEKAKLAKLPVTNLERLLEDPAAMATLGIEIRGGDVICSNPKPWTAKVLKAIVTDIATKRIKVADIFDKAKRMKYVTDVAKGQGAAHGTTATWALDKSVVATGVVAGGKSSKSTLSADRRTLIPLACKLRIPHARINAIYDELRRKLKIDEVVNSVSVMFRVFVELGIDDYMTRNKVTAKNDRLYSKITAVADYMESNGVMTKKQLKPVRMAVSNPNELHSTETLNAYVHNAAVHPTAADLKRSWDSLEQFVSAVWA